MSPATTTPTKHDIDDILCVLNAILNQIDMRFAPLEEQILESSHHMAYLSNQLGTIMRRLDAIETSQASATRHLQAQASHTVMQQPYRNRVRRLAGAANV